MLDQGLLSALNEVATRWPVVGGAAEVEGIPAGSWTVRVDAADGRSWVGRTTTSGTRDARMTVE